MFDSLKKYFIDPGGRSLTHLIVRTKKKKRKEKNVLCVIFSTEYLEFKI